jgi:acyl-coenzyme A thioesterase PaaI-like protein
MVQKLFTTQPNFSNALGLSPKHILEKDDGASEIKPLISRSKEGVAQYCLRYVVPKHACIKSIDGKDYEFPTTVFDDLTTLAIVNEDKNARPGVSTSLSTNLSPYGITRLPKAGDELDICVKVIKIGKTFGFAEAEAHCSETGAVIAIGKHTKFLNTGSLLQNVLLGPTVLPIASRVASMYEPKDLNATNTISMSDLFRLEPSKERRDGSILVLRKEHMNPMGTCHVRSLQTLSITFSLH